jgi:hypothetical protein
MPTAERFASRYASYWSAIFPQLEHFVRITNLGPKRLAPALEIHFPAERQALVSETAFMVWRLQSDSASSREQAAGYARERLSHLVPTEHLDVQLSADEWSIVSQLAGRIVNYLDTELRLRDVVVEPDIPGCGAVSGGTPDMLGTVRIGEKHLTAVVEVKSVDRAFRSSDFRQVAVYAALMFASATEIPDLFVILNPLRGTVVEIGASEFFNDTAHAAADEVLQRLVSEWSDPRLDG